MTSRKITLPLIALFMSNEDLRTRLAALVASFAADRRSTDTTRKALAALDHAIKPFVEVGSGLDDDYYNLNYEDFLELLELVSD